MDAVLLEVYYIEPVKVNKARTGIDPLSIEIQSVVLAGNGICL